MNPSQLGRHALNENVTKNHAIVSDAEINVTKINDKSLEASLEV